MMTRIPYRRSFEIFLIILSIFAVLRCDKNFNPFGNPQKTNTLPLNEVIDLGYKKTIINTDENISLTFDSLVTDSRCPNGVLCDWVGNAELAFTCNSVPFHLNTYSYFVQDTTIGHYNIRLVDVIPYPEIDYSFTPEDYIAKVLVTKN